MEDNNVFKCSGDCLSCRMRPNERREQWQYCAAQFSYNALRTMQAMQDAFSAMSGDITELKEKIEAIQNCEANVFDPTNHYTTQEGDGVTQ